MFSRTSFTYQSADSFVPAVVSTTEIVPADALGRNSGILPCSVRNVTVNSEPGEELHSCGFAGVPVI